ncbi:MAG: right-handed parallel beta-helix repeat-containing protein [Planctomycetota bacterium]|nr:MAG: right-handed parallel beta-helix repeat-containing protein [Planctomycetota bacterium]
MLVVLLVNPVWAKEYHVSVQGRDANAGSASDPLKTISAAAQVAQPGDMIIVHQGTYRERINPPRGGNSDRTRITYRAAEGEKVVIKGSDVISGWKEIRKGLWKVTLPNTYFDQYNPYQDVITGDWFNARGRVHHTGEVYLNGDALFEEVSLDKVTKKKMAWYCESDDKNTYLWANFQASNPNKELVEINVRPACFYPEKPGCNFITVRGFIMRHAATQWAAPTAEQIALIGTHWSKGWIIEDNVISDSKCVGITLGKDRATGHNKAQSADGYNKVVRRALENGWSKRKIGSHVVRNNTIYNCGAAGICGSMGGVFSQVTGNHIYNIHINKPFSGAEMAGIKLHAAIDTLISNNYIHHTCRGIWLDWMTQGTRVSANLCHNNVGEDLFLEVNHGPYVIDNNIFLSGTAVHDWSQGGSFSHNLLAGNIRRRPQGRQTPYHKEHSTEIAGLSNISGGDNRFYNNIFVGGPGLQIYNEAKLAMQVDGNVYLNGAVSYQGETSSVKLPKFNPDMKIVEEEDAVYLKLTLPQADKDQRNQLVTTELLGKARIPNLPYMNPDGTQLKIDSDYFDQKRNGQDPSPGPFENPGTGKLTLKVWPK